MLVKLLGNVGFGVKMLFYKQSDEELKVKLLQIANDNHLSPSVINAIKDISSHDQFVAALEMIKSTVAGGV